MITSGQIRPGDRLPSERTLAATLGLSRSALREAISTLESVGLLEARVGSGRYASQTGTDDTAGPLTAWMSLQPVGDVIALRRILEPDAVRAIPATRVAATLDEGEAMLAKMRRAFKSGNVVLATQLHTQFHRTLSQYAPTRLQRLLLGSMIAAVEDTQAAIFRLPVAGRESLERHAWILAPLRDGDVGSVAIRIGDHLEPAFTYTADAAEDFT
jgi:GntR family transcriptional repressor for pyruvate dehydrogenase complex